MTRRLRRFGVTMALAGAGVLSTCGPAGAAANAGAGCMGIGSSGNAGFPRDRAVISHEVNDLARDLGVSPGGVISGLAHEHAGSITGCFGDG